MQNVTEGFRLSPQQKRLWLLQQGIGADYRAQSAILIEGDLSAATLKESLRRVIARHEILRSVYFRLPGMSFPYQVVRDDSAFSWEELDLSDLVDQQSAIEDLFHQQSERPFNLDQGPVVNSCLLKLSDARYVLIMTLPSLCADARTLGVLFQEIADQYAAASREESLANEVVQYAQFSEWQNSLIDGGGAEEGREFWRENHLDAGSPALPFGNALAGAAGSGSDVFEIAISSDLSAKLDEVAETHGVAVGKVLLACWQILLWRLTAQPDITVYPTFDGRTYEELQDAVGLFAKALPVRCRFEENSTFTEVRAALRQQMSEVEEWQEYFVWDVGTAGNEDGSALPVGFEFDVWPDKREAAGLMWTTLKQSCCYERFKIKLACVRNEEGLLTALHYDSHVLSAQDTRRVLEEFETLLASIVENPQASIDEYELLSEAERRQVLFDFNVTAAAYPKDKTIHRLFEEHAARRPEQVAVVFGEQQLTYAQLNARANQLAHHLLALGGGAGTLVGICAERSVDMVVAILGVLKAGGAYVPLNPKDPLERLAFMFEDTGLSVLLTQKHLVEKLPQYWGEVVLLDGDREVISHQSEENPALKVTASDLAYIIYTSGTTGVPKGVMVEHRGVVNLAHWQAHNFKLNEQSRIAQFFSYSFDGAVGETFMALLNGATLVMLSAEDLDPKKIIDTINQQQLNVAVFVPSLLKQLDPDALEHPEQFTVVSVGEACPVDLAARWAQKCTFMNGYGPTEYTVYSHLWKVDPETVRQLPVVPIGTPIHNTRTFILDRRLNPVPIGVVGEIHITGAGIARGYLNRPETTAERFIPNPFLSLEDASDDRLYKTGDLGRYLPDGRIEFVGRTDEQIKLRGFRIELGEIEATLRQHPAVHEAVVLLTEDAQDKRLIAYAVLQRTHRLEAGELRRFLESRLPHFMIPAAFVMLDALPLTPNGKVDRAALRVAAMVTAERKTRFVGPRTPVEEILASIWRQVLKLDQVDVNDNFFELGGHSLLAIQALYIMREAFQVETEPHSLFESPTIAGLATIVEASIRSGNRLESRPIELVERSEALPLSYAQQRLWFLQQIAPESTAYSIPTAVRLSGQLNVAALEGALSEIVTRHETLRTTFQILDDSPVQIINPPQSVSIPLIDLSDLPEGERELRVEQDARAEAQQPFDLLRDTLFRARLLRLGPDEHVMLLNMHHIVSDHLSRGVLVRELTALYDAFSNNQPSPLPELRIQYADFAVWQRQTLQGEALDSQLAYWKQKLDGAPTLELPTDRPRPATPSFRGALQFFVIPKPVTEALRALSQKEGSTLFMTILAVFQTLLHRYTRQDDIVIGVPIANRNHPDIEPLIGFFVNTLAMRADLSGNPTFRELLARTRRVALEAYAHQDLPLERVVEALNLERDPSRMPLFQVVLGFLNDLPQSEIPGLAVSPLQFETGSAKFDLELNLAETEQGINGRLEYALDLFESSSMSRLVEHFQRLLDTIVADPDTRLSDLEIVSEAERRQLVLEFNQTSADYTKDICVHELFEEQVKKRPDAVALVYEKQSLTYAELNRRANQLAHHLRGLGVGPETRVAICVERSVEMVVAILGVLKAGGAYVPLDPAYPAERLVYMLEDCAPVVVLTNGAAVAALGNFASTAPVLDLDKDATAWANQTEQNPERTGNKGGSLAYIIYTSGSTGKPKGVMVTHANVSRLLLATDDWFGFGPEDVWTLFHSYAFDFSVWEIWGALAYGGRLIVVPKLAARLPEEFYKLLCESGVTVLNQTPSAFRQLMAAQGRMKEKHKLRYVIFGGEALDVRMLKPWYERNGESQTKLINMYGITETTVHVTYRELKQADVEGGVVSPIGRCIPDLKTYILDERGRVVPVGVAGEVYIGGEGVARGYLNRPELTAERFVPDAFGDKPGGRLYKSGDLGRWNAAGEIEFVGRSDFQVKIRGFRIELGEIEARLSSYPGVHDAVVLARENGASDKRLVAYYTGQKLAAETLRRHLSSALPDYMVPSAYVRLDALPLTTNGKLDRRALPTPEDQAYPTRGHESPVGEIETCLARIWADTLRLERVGRHDNFFELGGDSILSILVMSKARKAGLYLEPQEIFLHQTIAELAAQVRTSATKLQTEQEPVTGQVPLMPAQRWFFEQNLSEPHHYNQALVLEASQPLEPSVLREAVRHLLAHHDALRTRFVQTESGWQQHNDGPGEVVPFTHVNLSRLTEAEQEVAFARRSARLQAGFSLAEGPLMHVALFQHGRSKPDRVLVIIHHLVVDGVSWRILLGDLESAYSQLSRGETVDLPAKTTSLKQWAQRLTEYSQSEQLREEFDYWSSVRPEGLSYRMPQDISGGVNDVASTSTVSMSLGVEETTALLQEVPKAYHTEINDVLLTALAQAFNEWNGVRPLLVDLDGHGREAIFEDVDLSRTVGWFTSIFPVTIDLEGNGEPGGALKLVKEGLRRIPNRGLGYGLLRYLSGDAKIVETLNELPRAEVSFNYLGQFDQSFSGTSLFSLSDQSAGVTRSPRDVRPYLLEISAGVSEGQLRVVCVYSENLHFRSSIESFANNLMRSLRSLIEHCASPGTKGYTPSDFPEAELSQEELNELLAQYGGA